MKTRLMTPGPVEIPPSVLSEMAQPIFHHRTERHRNEQPAPATGKEIVGCRRDNGLVAQLLRHAGHEQRGVHHAGVIRRQDQGRALGGKVLQAEDFGMAVVLKERAEYPANDGTSHKTCAGFLRQQPFFLTSHNSTGAAQR